MIAKIGSSAHAALFAGILVCSRLERNRGELLVKRRHWLTGCTLAATSGLAALAPSTLFAAASPGQSQGARSAPQFLPLFPLGVVAFPGERLLLNVFEPRYKQLIAECAESGITFGIVTIVSGGASSIGTEMKLERILRTQESGAMDVEIRGVRVFRLEHFQREVEGKLYSGGLVFFDKNNPEIVPEIQGALVQLYNRRQSRMGFREPLAPPYAENLSFLIGHDVGMSQAQELQMLTLSAESDRQAHLLQQLLRRP